MQNPGIIGGTLSGLPPLLTVVTFSTMGAFLLFLFFLAQYLLPIRAPQLRAGLSILMGGISGNASDRLIHGHVTDFVAVGSLCVLNLADVAQWVGYALVAVGLARSSAAIWREKESRHRYWIDVPFQLRFALKTVAVALGFALIVGTLSVAYLSAAIARTAPGQPASGPLIASFLISFGSVTLLYIAICFIASVVISHRLVGPIHAFRRFVSLLKAGKASEMRLRARDEFKVLETIARELREWMGEQGPRSR